MNIGRQLRELRDSKGWSQGEIEKRTGLMRSYLSRVECGHTIPSLETLEKWAKALDLELYQVFYQGRQRPVAPKAAEGTSFHTREEELLNLFRRMSAGDKDLFLALARRAVKRWGNHEQPRQESHGQRRRAHPQQHLAAYGPG